MKQSRVFVWKWVTGKGGSDNRWNSEAMKNEKSDKVVDTRPTSPSNMWQNMLLAFLNNLNEDDIKSHSYRRFFIWVSWCVIWHRQWLRFIWISIFFTPWSQHGNERKRETRCQKDSGLFFQEGLVWCQGTGHHTVDIRLSLFFGAFSFAGY